MANCLLTPLAWEASQSEKCKRLNNFFEVSNSEDNRVFQTVLLARFMYACLNPTLISLKIKLYNVDTFFPNNLLILYRSEQFTLLSVNLHL